MRRLPALVVLPILLLLSAPALSQPDLSVILFFATEENDNCVPQFYYAVQVFNQGDETAEGFALWIVHDADSLPQPEDMEEHEGLLHEVPGALAPDDMYQVGLWWKKEEGIAPGQYKSWLVVDPLDVVAESDEGNNTDGPLYLHTDPIVCDPPNLSLESFQVWPEGENLSYSMVVKNQTEQPVEPSFRIDLYRHRDSVPGYHEPGDEHLMVTGLEGLGTTEWTTVWNDVPNGKYDAYAVVDGDNVLVETSEADNIKGPVPIIICRDCQSCPEGEVAQPCLCGGETLADGYCCNQEYSKQECLPIEPEQAGEPGPEPGPDLRAAPESRGEPAETLEEPEKVAVDGAPETGNPPPKTSGGGGCIATGKPARGGLLLLLMWLVLLAVAAGSCRYRHR